LRAPIVLSTTHSTGASETQKERFLGKEVTIFVHFLPKEGDTLIRETGSVDRVTCADDPVINVRPQCHDARRLKSGLGAEPLKSKRSLSGMENFGASHRSRSGRDERSCGREKALDDLPVE
jgi:hypothetical protein